MRGRNLNSEESVFLMHIQKENASGGENNPAPLFRGVRTARHTYAVADDGRWCLYDNHADPYQMHNLIDDATQAALIRKLDALVMNWLKRANDPFPFDAIRKKRSALDA